MGGFSLLGQLAGGYAQAAERDRQRQFETETQNRQNALGMVKILLENPAVPPEYKGALVQHGLDIVHTPYGKKLPSTDKMLQSLPQIGTPAQTQQAPVPPVQLGMPATPPAPQGIGTGATQGAPSLTQSATAANGGTPPYIPPPVGQGDRAFSTGRGATPISAAGPGPVLPTVAPPPVPIQMTTGPNGEQIPVMTQQGGPIIPGRQQAVTQAASANYTPAGQFHFMSPQEQAMQQGQANMALFQAQVQGMREAGFTDEQIAAKLGFKPDLHTVAPGAKLVTNTGKVVAEGGPRPFQGPRYRPEEVAGFPTGNVIDEQTHRTIPESEWSKDPEAKIAGEGAKAALKAKVDERLRQEQASFQKAMAINQQGFINALQKQSATEAKSALDSTRTAWQKINADVSLDNQRMQEMDKSLEKAKQGDQQAMFALTANHILMTAGQKGGRATQAMYNMAEQSAPWLARINARFDKDGYLTGVVLTPDQAQSMYDLAKDRMAIRSQTSSEAHQAYTDASKEYKSFLSDLSKGKVKTSKPLAQPATTQPGVTHVWDPQKGLVPVGGNE